MRATGPTYFSLLNRYVTNINISSPMKSAADTLKFVDVTGKLGGVNDQMKQLIENNWIEENQHTARRKTTSRQQIELQSWFMTYNG